MAGSSILPAGGCTSGAQPGGATKRSVIRGTNHPDRVVVAAGAPWFMTLFGRDSLWASVMAMPVDPFPGLGHAADAGGPPGHRCADGTLAEPPIALIEVQAYVYVAYLSRAWLAYTTPETRLWETYLRIVPRG